MVYSVEMESLFPSNSLHLDPTSCSLHAPLVRMSVTCHATSLHYRLHKYGLCLDKTIKYTIQEEIGKHFLDSAIKLVQEGKTFAFVLDNIDRDVRVHGMRFESQNKSVHAV